MVSYERLWKTMEKKGISQYRLINHYKISAGQIGRMKKNMHVSTHTLEVFCNILQNTSRVWVETCIFFFIHTLEVFCNILQCPVEDIVEVILDPQEPDGKEPSSAGGRAVGRTAAGARDAEKAEGVTGDKAPGKPGSRSGVQGTGKAAAATRDNTSGKPASRSGVQGTGKAAAATRDNASGKLASRSGVQGTGKTAAVTGEKPAGKAEDRTGGKTAGKTPAGSREGNK